MDMGGGNTDAEARYSIASAVVDEWEQMGGN